MLIWLFSSLSVFLYGIEIGEHIRQVLAFLSTLELIFETVLLLVFVSSKEY